MSLHRRCLGLLGILLLMAVSGTAVLLLRKGAAKQEDALRTQPPPSVPVATLPSHASASISTSDLPRPAAELHQLLSGGSWDEELIGTLVSLEDWIGRADPVALEAILSRVLDSSVPIRERGLLALALSASAAPRVRLFLSGHLIEQDDLAVAFAYSLALKPNRPSLAYEDRQGFWRGAFLVPTLSDLLAPEFIRQHHARRLNTTNLSEVPEEALQETINVGTVFQAQVLKPVPQDVKAVLFAYLDRGSSLKAAREMVFLVPLDAEFGSIAKSIYEDDRRDVSLRQSLLTGYIRSSGPGVLDSLLRWSAKEQDPALVQVIATGLCSLGSASPRKAEVVAAFAAMLTVQALDPSTVSHLTSHLVLLDSPEAVDLLSRLSSGGVTPDVSISAIKALGANTGAQATVPARSQLLLEWMNSSDQARRMEAGYALYNLAAVGTKDRGVVEKAVAALDALRQSLTQKKDQMQLDIMLATLRAKIR